MFHPESRIATPLTTSIEDGTEDDIHRALQAARDIGRYDISELTSKAGRSA